MIEIFFVSFLVALTGALSPGPVLTFTVYKSLQGKKGYMAGLFISLGHASLELGLLTLILLGASVIFQNVIILIIIGIAGGILLMLYGILTIRSVYKREYDIDFSLKNENIKGFQGNSFLGGIVTSLSNPYWIGWWITVGLGIMVQFNLLTFKNPLGIILFYLGHELGDLIWFGPISIFVFLGAKSLNSKVYKYVLIGCGLFMLIFGGILLFRTILFPPSV
ncbi:MAG: LysE family transporter [Promethearchaeota archaeon]